MKDNFIYLIKQLAKRNNIKIDKNETKVQLLSHPHYPSLNCITDLFNHFQIKNLALRVETDLETFEQLPTSFLVQIKDDGKPLLAVASKKDDQVELTYSEKNIKTLTLDLFLDKWTGIIIAVEEPEKATVVESQRSQNIKNVIFAGALIVIAGLFLFSKPSMIQTIQFILSSIGVYISYLIVQQELGVHSAILDKICSGKNQKSDCDAVLNSDGASVLGLFKLSDAGLVYFLSLSLTWFFIVINKLSFNSIVYALSTLAVIFTIYSIYYQWKIVKNWCPLCLTTITVLWLQLGSLVIFEPFRFNRLCTKQ